MRNGGDRRLHRTRLYLRNGAGRPGRSGSSRTFPSLRGYHTAQIALYVRQRPVVVSRPI